MKRKAGRARVTIIFTCAVWCGLAPGAAAAALPLPFGNLNTITTTNQLTNYAASASPAYPVTTNNITRSFRAAFSPASLNTRIALQSDDGADVFINGVSVLARKGQETHWQDFNLSSSYCALSIIDYTFTNTEEYCIEIDYQNGAYTPGDTDGVSFYAWNGGGYVRDGIPVWGANFAPVGCSATLYTCGTITNWSVNPTGIVSLSGSGGSITVQGISNGTATVTAKDSDGRSGSRQVQVFKLGVSPKSFTICEGVPITLVLTNNEVTNGVIWSTPPPGTVSADTRTNTVTFATGGTTNIVTATWNGCQAKATGVVVRVASLNVTPPRLCGSGQATFTAATSPAGNESLLNWAGEGVSGSGALKTVTYTTPGVKPVTVSCGTSQLTISATVHYIDITNGVEYGIAGSTVPVIFGLSSNSFGPFLWDIDPAGPSFVGGTQGSTASLLPGNTAGAFTVRAYASFLPSCTDTATLQVVQATFSGGDIALCEGSTSNLTVTVNPPSALSLLSFDTVTNTTVGPSNTHAHVTAVNGTNLTIHGDVAGTAYLRVRLGSNFRIAGTIQIVRVTFPSEPLYVGVGKTADYFVAIVPTNASVTFDTVSSAIVTATAIGGGVRLTGVAPGTTQVRATVGGGAICATKDVSAVRVKFATNWVYICNGNSTTVGVTIDPPGSPVTFLTSDTSFLQLTVQGTNVTVRLLTNGAAAVSAMIGSAEMDWLVAWGFTVRFPSNPWYAAPGGLQPFTVLVDPADFAQLVNFMSSDTNIIMVTGGCAPPCVMVRGVSNGTAQVIAFVGSTNHTCSSKPVTVLTPVISSVQWANLDASPITNTNPNPGGGYRVFPDRPLPGAPPANQMRVRATVSPSVNFSNAVYFRAYDVDDPYTNAPPIDNESNSADNRGALNQLPATPFSSDTNGIAEATFTVSMQPGDNFRVLAATDPNAFTGLAALQNDGVNARVVTNATGVPVPANQATPLLTVWRRLHVEVDSMSAVVSNVVAGSITAISGSATIATNLTLNVNLRTGLIPADNSPNLSGSSNRGRFENGWIRIGPSAVLTTGVYGNGDDFVRNPAGFSIPAEIVSGGNTLSAGQITALSGNAFTITANLGTVNFAGATFRAAGTSFTITANTANTVTISTTPAIGFTLHDDDDDTILPHVPDTGLMTTKFAPAYIVPIVDGGGLTQNNKQSIAFRANVDATSHAAIDSELNKNGAFESDGNRSPSYWIAYILTAYQAQPAADFDADTTIEWGPQGATGGGSSYRSGALYFHESTRDYSRQLGLTAAQATILEQRHVVHEIGHQFAIVHTDPTHNVGIYSSDEYNLSLDPGFEPVHLDVIRAKITSPGR